MASNVLRAIGIGIQSAQGTPNTTPTWLRYIEKRDWNPNINYDTPKYERYVRWMEGDAIPTTKHMSVQIDGRVDALEFPRLLTAFAAYSFGSSTHTYDFAAAGLKFLTVYFADGTTGEMWRAVDVRGDKLSMDLDYTAGTYKFSATLLGLDVTRVTSSLPTIAYSAYTRRDPFAPWQTPILFGGSGGTAFCAIMSKISVDNHLTELYCSPTADPGSTTLPGLAPTEIMEGEASGTWDLTARYVAYTGSPMEDYLTNTDRAYQIKSTYYDAVTPYVMTITIPRFKSTKGHFDTDVSKVALRQEISGPMLLDDTTATGFKITVVNGLSTY